MCFSLVSRCSSPGLAHPPLAVYVQLRVGESRLCINSVQITLIRYFFGVFSVFSVVLLYSFPNSSLIPSVRCLIFVCLLHEYICLTVSLFVCALHTPEYRLKIRNFQFFKTLNNWLRRRDFTLSFIHLRLHGCKTAEVSGSNQLATQHASQHQREHASEGQIIPATSSKRLKYAWFSLDCSGECASCFCCLFVCRVLQSLEGFSFLIHHNGDSELRVEFHG